MTPPRAHVARGWVAVAVLAALLAAGGGALRGAERPVIGPPDGARVFAPDGVVPLAWWATGVSRWHVEVTAQGRPWYSADLGAPTVKVRAPGGPLYRWRVIGPKGEETVTWRTFQVVDSPRLDLRGAAGGAGRDGFTTGNGGERGQDGGAARDLEVWVERVDGWVRVRTETVLGVKEALYLAPSSPPLIILAGGGAGGPGGSGANGMGAVVQGPGGPMAAAGPGAMGGDGGDGGAGATVRLHTAAELEDRVRIDVSGGEGGQGGLGGSGSIGAPGPRDTVIYGPPGAPGANGRNGHVGPRGRVLRIP